MLMREFTPIEVENFAKWLRELTAQRNIDPALIGITNFSHETVKKFMQEYCQGLTYSECKDHILEVFPILRYPVNIDEEAITLAQQELDQFYGTPYVSQAFKQFCKKYTYSQIQEMLSDIENSELSIFFDFVKAKYGANDMDIRLFSELTIYNIKIQYVRYGTINLFLQQFATYNKLKPAQSIYDFIANGDDIYIASEDDKILVLIAIIDSNENVILPVTHSGKQYIAVFNMDNKRYALLK